MNEESEILFLNITHNYTRGKHKCLSDAFKEFSAQKLVGKWKKIETWKCQNTCDNF